MATWEDLRSYLQSNYRITEDAGTLLALDFEVGSGRTQRVLVSKGSMEASPDEWAVIASFFGSTAVANLASILGEAGEYVVGGVAAYGDKLAVRHSVPLGHLDGNEFEEPLHLVTRTADALENKFFGGDSY